jgi:esterase
VETARRLTTPDGVSLAYRLWRQDGRRPLLVLLHGMASNLTRWSEFLEQTTLKERFDILRVDLRGHNDSFTRKRVGMGPWSRDLEQILDAEGYDRAVFIGHSLGANVALHFAQYRPARVAGLVLIDPVFTEALRGSALRIHRLRWVVSALVLLLRGLNALGLRRRRIPQRDLRALDEDVRVRLIGAGKTEAFVKRYTSPLADLKFFSTANYLQEFQELTRPIPPAPGLQAPMLVLISKAVTFSDTATTCAVLARYPATQVVMLSAYHWPLTEKPVEVRQAIERWVGQNIETKN